MTNKKNINRGIFNRYRRGMPLFERCLKDIGHLGHILRLILKAKKPKRMLVYPHYPSRAGTIYKIAPILGYYITNIPKGKFDFVVYWEYATERDSWSFDSDFGSDKVVVNALNTNISKDYLDDVMFESFGYRLNVDPLETRKKLVKKSVINALHDGKIVQGPCTPEDGFVFQRLIDSSVESGEVMDLRVVIIGKHISHLYQVYRRIDNRFVGEAPRANLQVNIDEVLTKNEQKQLLEMAMLLNLDYAELDVLRDRGDGKIYVVDANNTPHGPPPKLTQAEKSEALRRLCEAFKTEFKA